MTAKEKAIEILSRYYKEHRRIIDGWDSNEERFKDCQKFTLIAINEIERAIDFDWMEVQNLESEHRWWDNVRTEITYLTLKDFVTHKK
jgi:hypothetical protein